MCFYFRASKKVLQKLHGKYEGIEEVLNQIGISQPSDEWTLNGFSHPDTIVAANDYPSKLQTMNWGLIPFWAKDRSIQNSTLNAKIETLSEKPSFRNYVNNRCLVFADGFFEWQWLNAKGKEKQKYLLTIENAKPFAFAGIWSAWTDQTTGEQLKTFSIITAQANDLMEKIHNTKKRMPIIIEPNFEKLWLEKGIVNMWNDNLIAAKIG